MRIIKRVWNVIMGLILRKTDEIETRNIPALIASLEERKKSEDTRFAKSLAIMVSTVKGFEQTLMSKKKELESVESAIVKCLTKGKTYNTELAKELSAHRELLLRSIEQYEVALTNSNKNIDMITSTQRKTVKAYNNKIAQLKLTASEVALKAQLVELTDVVKSTGCETLASQLDSVETIVNKQNNLVSAQADVNEMLAGEDMTSKVSEVLLDTDGDECLAKAMRDLNIEVDLSETSNSEV